MSNEQHSAGSSNPSDAPLERVRWLLQTQFIRGSGLTDLQAIIVQAAMHEIERLQKQLDTEDKAHTSTIEERDRLEAYADQLAEMIGVFCEVDVGEHSSENCPWEEAIEAMRVAIGNKAHGNETLPQPSREVYEARGDYINELREALAALWRETCLAGNDNARDYGWPKVREKVLKALRVDEAHELKANEPVEREWHFDRYRDGKLMAEGTSTFALTYHDALAKVRQRYPTDAVFKLRDEKNGNPQA